MYTITKYRFSTDHFCDLSFHLKDNHTTTLYDFNQLIFEDRNSRKSDSFAMIIFSFGFDGSLLFDSQLAADAAKECVKPRKLETI